MAILSPNIAAVFLLTDITTNIFQTTIKDMNDLNIRIIQEIEVNQETMLHKIFRGIKKKLNFCISIKDDSFK